MKVFLRKESNIISPIESDGISLESISENGNFVYEVSYSIDPKKALSKDCVIVRISATSSVLARKASKIFNTKSPDVIIKNILQKTSFSKDSTRSQASNVFFTYRSDFTSRIPNDQTNILGKKTIAGLPEFLFKKKTVKLVSTKDLKDSNSIVPVLENNISTSILSQELAANEVQRSPATSKTVSTNLAFLKSIDPATISGARTNTIQSAQKGSSGVVSLPSTRTKNLSGTEKVSLLGNLLNVVNPQNISQIQNSLINVLVTQPTNDLEIKETLEIPFSLLQADEFFFVFELVDKNGIVVQDFNVSVPHSRNVANLKIPYLPPLIEVLQTGVSAKNVINVKQLDPNATGIAVYRKEHKIGMPITNSQYTLVARVPTVKGNGFVRVEDVVNNYNSILYRAIPYNSNNIMSSEFSAKGAKPLTLKTKSSSKRRNFISLTASVLISGIQVEIRDVPSGVCTVTLYKKDKTIAQQTRTLVTSPIKIESRETQTPILVLDSNVKENRVYEYFCDLLYPDGTLVSGSSVTSVKFNPITANIVSTRVSAPTVVQDGDFYDVEFEISSEISLSNQDRVKKALESQGLLSYFNDAVSGEKEKLQRIIAYGVKRINLTLGTTEDFGVATSGNFSDKVNGLTSGVLPLESGNEYRYEISTFFRSAETTLSTATRTVQVSQNVSYELQPQKWLHPYTLKTGVLISERSIARNHSEDLFSFGTVGDITSTTVSLAKILPSIIEAKAQKLFKGQTLVKWRVQGNITKIDHFIITLEMSGMKTVVGKSHNISESNYFQFVDVLDSGEHGSLKYAIIPVYFDYSRGTEVVTNEVVI